MRRLTALIKAIVPFPAEIRDEFFKIIKAVDLKPGEWIPDDLPTGTTIFVEDGFLLLTSCRNKKWRCCNFYPEGTAAIAYSAGAAEMKDDSFRVRATETSRIYFLTPDDEDRINDFFPNYKIASRILRQRSFLKSERRGILFKVPPGNRIMYVDTYFRNLMRAPIDDLAEFLCLETERQKKVLGKVQNIRSAYMRYFSPKDN